MNKERCLLNRTLRIPSVFDKIPHPEKMFLSKLISKIEDDKKS